MKRSRRLLLLSVCAVVLSSACGDGASPTEPVSLSDADNGRTLSVERGTTVVVTLESNPSTGYSWTVSRPAPQLELQGEPAYVPAVTSAPLVGSGGVQVFTFRAVSTGKAPLTLTYRRSTGPADREYEVTITVT